MYCKKCRNEITEGYKFCEKCGEGVINSVKSNENEISKKTDVLAKLSKMKSRKDLIYVVISIVLIVIAIVLISNRKTDEETE